MFFTSYSELKAFVVFLFGRYSALDLLKQIFNLNSMDEKVSLEFSQESPESILMDMKVMVWAGPNVFVSFQTVSYHH
jgi:hypothetical protein